MASLLASRSLPRAVLVAVGRAGPSGGAVVLAYHDVRDVAEGYHVTPDRLRSHVELLRSSGRRVVPLGDVVDALRDGRPIDGLAAVTFDDAIVGVAALAVPVLAALEAPATVFAVAARLGSEPDWTTGEQRTLAPDELRELAAQPFVTIGCHAGTHRSLPGLRDDELRQELVGSRDRLRELVAAPVDLLAYPYGHHDARVRDTAAAAGFRAGFTFLNGRIEPGQDLFRLPRFTMGQHQSRLRLAHHLARSAASWPDTQLPSVP